MLSDALLTNHEQTSTNTSVGTLKTKLLSNLDQTAGGSLSWETLCLVDLAQHGIGRLRDERSSKTSNETGAEVDGGLQSIRSGRLVQLLPGELSNLLVDDELSHGIWDPVPMISIPLLSCKNLYLLLEQDRTKTSVERANTLVLQHLAESTDEAIGICWLGNETDTGGLKRAEGDVGEEFGER